MTRDDKIAAIRAACIKANPEIETRFSGKRGVLNSTISAPVRLADVLFSLPGYSPGNRIIGVDHEGTFVEWGNKSAFEYVKNIPQWNLLKDDLQEQSDECVDFLYELLK